MYMYLLLSQLLNCLSYLNLLCISFCHSPTQQQEVLLDTHPYTHYIAAITHTHTHTTQQQEILLDTHPYTHYTYSSNACTHTHTYPITPTPTHTHTHIPTHTTHIYIYRTRSIVSPPPNVRPPPFFAQSYCRKHFCHDCTPTQRLIY